MKKFQCLSRKAIKLLLSVFVVLACSLHLGIRVSEGQGITIYSNNDVAGVATAAIYSNAKDDTVVLTFTITNFGCTISNSLIRGIIQTANRQKDGSDVSNVPFTVERKGSTLPVKFELKTDGTPIATGVYTFKVHLRVNYGSCGKEHDVKVTVTAPPPALNREIDTTTPSIPANQSTGSKISTITFAPQGTCSVGSSGVHWKVTTAGRDGTDVKASINDYFSFVKGSTDNILELQVKKTPIPAGDYLIYYQFGDDAASLTLGDDCSTVAGYQIAVTGPASLQQGETPITTPPAATPGAAATPEAKPTPEAETPPKRVVVYRCPIGWQRTNGVGRPTPKVFVQAIEVEIDKSNRAGIYTATAVEIYVDPTEGLTDLAGWKLKLAVPYNHGREYLLTAENAVVNEEGIVRIESPEADPFPIRDLTYVGQVLPGFDYRLFTEKGRRVDFAISCYKDTNATLEGLAAMETPRIIRSVDTTNLDWAALNFLRSKWGMPAEAVPAAPRLSSPQLRLATMWSVLKQR